MNPSYCWAKRKIDLKRQRTNRLRLSLDEYESGVLGCDRAVLARAITLIESSHPEDQENAQKLLGRLMRRSSDSHRIGVTGVPGVGKSTFIDSFGSNLTKAGHKVAVLAVDPTSSRSGGSILGDKTRMAQLSVDPNAFVRPSPTSGVLGGVARKTRETITLCEAAGFDVIIVETVGVGQSETVVAGMVDFFLVLMLPGAGDELQGIKKGILEIADMIAINKADGENKKRAAAASGEYRAALNILTPQSQNWTPPVVTCSGLKNDGLDEVWNQIKSHHVELSKTGEFQKRRQEQLVSWMHELLESSLLQRIFSDEKNRTLIERLQTEVGKQNITAVAAVKKIMSQISE